jgi:predicted ribosome quality control (RQC) complex YloA/Tae2 family protein
MIIMALDGIFLHSIVKELTDSMLGCKIDKVNQPEKDEIILTFKKNRKNHRLLISASSNYPRIHFTNNTKNNPLSPPMFCMVLRKYLNRSKVLSINQIDGDRIIVMDFESTDELGFDSIYSLVIEIMGRHSNITLVRKRDNIVMDSIKHITGDINSYRNLYPGIDYIYPPKSTKLNPFNFTYIDFIDFVKKNSIEGNEKFFLKVFTGISKQLSKELYFRTANNDISLDIDNETDYNSLYDFISAFFSEIYNNRFFFASYFDQNNKINDFHCVKLSNLGDVKEQSYSSPSELLEDFYAKKDKSDRLYSKSADLQKLINNNLDRCNKKIKILNKTLKQCEDKGNFKLYGELLTANIYNIHKGLKEIEVLNYYSEDGEYIKINLDENKTPSENVQTYYKKYNKLKKSEEMAHVQLKLAYEEIEYLQSVLTNIKNIEENSEILEMRKELVEAGYLKYKKTSKDKKQKNSKPLHFISSDGIDMYVGKNNLQNDYLTLKFAHKHDIWMHTKNIPGSHVIVKNNGNLSNETLEEAANLAAYYSKAKNSTKVPVDYTEVKNVKKPSRAKPGMVIYYTNKTFYITPVEPNVDRVK